MRNIIALSSISLLFCACVINLDETTPTQKSSIEKYDEACKAGNQEVCALLEQHQKKVEQENRKKLELSGAHDRGRK
ncbi:hypothetical protein [Fluviispira sanaruensis]|uniref:Lipoprotein n=1 Tax=Fluviispira sanaruensis TaxID=2493639 RepID=A0A4P2VJ14_FLUSA|nr:hypothetical protein [Fluviispira sanaruensis]BBH53173.1 hypothetical protein JCM31447_16160 [Fluviispira sanaruensis]